MKLLLLNIFFIFFLGQKCFCQESTGYTYLLHCYPNAIKDSFEVDIKGFGEIPLHSLMPDTAADVSIYYYSIPNHAAGKSRQKNAKSAAGLQIDTWKNNSRIIYSRQTDDGQVTIIDTRLHILIEDIYMQSIVICDGTTIYEIDSILDTNEKDFFDGLVEKLRERKCL